MRIGEVLMKMGFITRGQLEAMIIEQEESRKNSQYEEPLGNIMIRKGVISEEQLDKALVEYFKYLAADPQEAAYVRETAKVAMKALDRKSSSDRLSEESKLTMLRRIHEYEEKIAYLEKSIRNLSSMEQKKVIVETIDKENKEIQQLLHRIEILRKDLEKFS